MAHVSVRNLGVSFGSLSVLQDLDLDVESGEFIVLLGPSGCGKSTLLNAIAGLVDIAEGQIWIGGKNVTWEEPKDRGIGMVFQSYALYPRMTVEKNLSFGLRTARVPRPEIAERIDFASKLLRIETLMDRRPGQLSGGQRQRVAIGRALVRRVDVFLFDEPLSNLDALLRNELRIELKRLHQELGSTMIYVTHDQIEALTLADRVAVMHAGRIQQLATPSEVYRKPANRFVAEFVGSPAMNIRKGKLANGPDGPSFQAEGLRLPLTGYNFVNGFDPGREVEMGVRPEHVVVGGGADRDSTIEMIDPMGAETLVWCRVGDGLVSVRMEGESEVRVGETLKLGFPAGRLNIFDSATGARL